VTRDISLDGVPKVTITAGRVLTVGPKSPEEFVF
jgi:hypothetical protein